MVDDNEDSDEVTAILLRLERHEVAVAHCASDAIQHAGVASPDVLLLDIDLPDMDGYALAGHLRAVPATRDAFFIALTGFGRQQDIKRSKTAGFDHHLTKPIEPSELIALIASLG